MNFKILLNNFSILQLIFDIYLFGKFKSLFHLRSALETRPWIECRRYSVTDGVSQMECHRQSAIYGIQQIQCHIWNPMDTACHRCSTVPQMNCYRSMKCHRYSAPRYAKNPQINAAIAMHRTAIPLVNLESCQKLFCQELRTIPRDSARQKNSCAQFPTTEFQLETLVYRSIMY